MPSFLERKLAGALVPSGHRPALGLRCRVGRCWTSATGRQHPRRQARVSCLWHDGEGSVKPPSRCPTGRERRGKAPVSLAFSHALRAHKVKGKVVGLCPTPRNPLKRVDLNFTWLPFLLSFFPQHVQCLHQLLLLHPAQLRGFHRLLQVLLHPPQLLFL